MGRLLAWYPGAVTFGGIVLLTAALFVSSHWSIEAGYGALLVFFASGALRAFQIPTTKYSALNLLSMVAVGGTLVIGEELMEPDYVRAVTIQRWAEHAGFKLVRTEGWAIEYLLKFTRPITQVDMVREAASQSQ